jgi:hypothetical protein
MQVYLATEECSLCKFHALNHNGVALCKPFAFAWWQLAGLVVCVWWG